MGYTANVPDARLHEGIGNPLLELSEDIDRFAYALDGGDLPAAGDVVLLF